MFGRDFRPAFQGRFRGHGRGFVGRSRGRARGFRGQGPRMYSNFNEQESGHLALQAAEDHQCNNLSFETKDPGTKNSRIFVGNIHKLKVSRSDLYVIFSKYGTITAISHLTSKSPTDHCAFAFVQFTTPESAMKATMSENGQGYYGYALGVKLAETKIVNGATSPSTSQTGPLFSKRSSTSMNDASTTPAKKARVEPGPPPDILVCGTCHQGFDGLEAMIVHKREPCKSVKKCRCDEENIPDFLFCGVCGMKLASPWQLILHASKRHELEICKNIDAADEEAETQVVETEEIGEEDFQEENDPEGINLDDELMEEGDEELT